MSTTTSSTNAVDKLLRDGCARNTPLELHYEEPKSGRLIVGRTRMLQLGPDEILAGTPIYRQDDGLIPAHHSFTAYLILNKTLYAFETSISTFGVRVQLNEEKHVSGMAMCRPTGITKLQRRAHYRIMLAGGGPITVEMARCHPVVPDACPIDGRVGRSSIVDLSARGIGLLIDRRILPRVKPGDRFYLTFTLPDVDDELCMLAVARHSLLIERSASLKVGFAFVPWAGRSFNRCQAEIARFTAEHQRRSLRRKRER